MMAGQSVTVSRAGVRRPRSPDERSDIRGGVRVIPDIAALIRATNSQWTAGQNFAVSRAGHTQGIYAGVSHRTHTDWLRERGASITTSLAAGGRAVVHHDERYHWRPRGPDSPKQDGVFEETSSCSGHSGPRLLLIAAAEPLAPLGPRPLLAFVLLELMAVIGGVAVFLGVVMDVDLPFFAVSEE